MTVYAGERKIVPLGVSAQVKDGGTAIVNGFALAHLQRGAVGYVMKNGNVSAERGSFLYLQLNLSYFARLNPMAVFNDMQGVKFRDLYDMPDWFWHRKDFGSPGQRP